MHEINDIELEFISDLIPEILYKKFNKLNLLTINDILNLSTEDFRNLPSIGKTVEIHFNSFKELIFTSPEIILNTYNLNCPKYLPFNFSENLGLLELIKLIIEDYIKLIEAFNFKTTSSKTHSIRDIDIFRKFYGLQSQKYEMDKIAIRHRIHRERVRQIVSSSIIPEIRCLMNGEYIEKWKCKCKNEAYELIQSYRKDLAGTPILSEHKLLSWLKDYGIDLNINDLKSYFIVLLNAWGYESVGLSRHYHLRDNVFYVDQSINKEIFLDIGIVILNFLEKMVIPVSFDDIVIEVLENFDVEDDFINLLCENIYEIEKTDNDFYQIRFERLSSVNDKVYRLLYEKQKELTFNELLHLINKRLLSVNGSMTMESLKQTLRRTDYIVPIGKTGSWTLKDLNTNVESQINLILKTLRTIDKPLKVSEIARNINESFQRKDITSKSIAANLRNYKKYFVKLKGSRYALIETADLYKNDIVKETSLIKKKEILKTDVIASKAVNILENTLNSKMKLIELVKLLVQSNNSYSKMDIYNAISKNPLTFKKENTKSKVKIISLTLKTNNDLNSKNELSSKYKWNELKKILVRELKPIFHSNIQPTYQISLEDSLDLFFKLLVFDISSYCPELMDIADRILPTLYKFYLGASDRNDKLNYLKQIVTSQESYFKKLLYIINSIDYLNIRNTNKGFGVVLDKLNRIDNSKNRYLDLKSASNADFGKHCSRAYNNRNVDTHNANSWTELEIIDTKTSCLVFMIYGTFEYSNEISKI